MSRPRRLFKIVVVVLVVAVAAGRGMRAWVQHQTRQEMDLQQDLLTLQLRHNAPTPLPTSPTRTRPPDEWSPARNLVLVIGCTVRKDQIGLYGGADHVTPFLDRLAERGVFFDDAIVATPWTRPAVAALLSGRHALSLGLADPGKGRNDRRLSPSVMTLPRRLQKAGWLTLGASANPNITETFGFHLGFDGYQFGLGAGWRDKVSGETVMSTLLQQLDDRRAAGDDRPFYLQALIFDTHARRRVSEEEVAPFRQPGLPERIAVYRATLHRLDAAVAHLHQGLAERGLLDDTLFVFVSDHGEGLEWPTHHGHAHGLFFGSSTVHMPWILAGPGLPEGRRVPGVASQIDVLPTLLDLLALPPEPAAEGHTLFPALMTHNSATPDRTVYVDTWFGAGNRVASFDRTRACQLDLAPSALIDGTRGAPFHDGCTDRLADPLGFHPFDPADGWREDLLSWRQQQKDLAAGLTSDKADVDRDLAAHLAALGYVDEGEEPTTDSSSEAR